MAVARIVMMIFGRKVRETLEEAGVEIYLDTCYVDDLRYVISLLAMYMAWDKENKCWKDLRYQKLGTGPDRRTRSLRLNKTTGKLESVKGQDQEIPDPVDEEAAPQWEQKENAATTEEKKEHTKEQFRRCINSMMDFLKLTVEVEADYTDSYIPN